MTVHTGDFRGCVHFRRFNQGVQVTPYWQRERSMILQTFTPNRAIGLDVQSITRIRKTAQPSLLKICRPPAVRYSPRSPIRHSALAFNGRPISFCIDHSIRSTKLTSASDFSDSLRLFFGTRALQFADPRSALGSPLGSDRARSRSPSIWDGRLLHWLDLLSSQIVPPHTCQYRSWRPTSDKLNSFRSLPLAFTWSTARRESDMETQTLLIGCKGSSGTGWYQDLCAGDLRFRMHDVPSGKQRLRPSSNE